MKNMMSYFSDSNPRITLAVNDENIMSSLLLDCTLESNLRSWHQTEAGRGVWHSLLDSPSAVLGIRWALALMLRSMSAQSHPSQHIGVFYNTEHMLTQVRQR